MEQPFKSRALPSPLPEPEFPDPQIQHPRVIQANLLEPTIFHEPWWLNLATSNSYHLAEVTDGAGKTIGRLPYAIQKYFRIPSIDLPMLTHFLGPGLIPGEGSPNNLFLKKLAITRELIHKLPSMPLVRFKLHHGITDTIAFQEQGFRTSVQFTHEIHPAPPDELWSNMRNKTRNVIRRAQERVTFRDLTDPDEFLAFYRANLKARGLRNHLNPAITKNLIAATLQRTRGRILAAYDVHNMLCAANFYIWDKTSYYFLLTTRTHDAGNGTTSLLLWEAIKDAAHRGLIFDSDGLNNQGSILFLAGWGSTIKPRYIVTKTNATGLLLQGLQHVIWGQNSFVRG